MQVKVKCRERRLSLSFSVDNVKRKEEKRTEEQAAFIVGNRKEMCSCEALRDKAGRLKDVEGPPMVNIAEFYMQKTNGSAIAVFYPLDMPPNMQRSRGCCTRLRSTQTFPHPILNNLVDCLVDG